MSHAEPPPAIRVRRTAAAQPRPVAQAPARPATPTAQQPIAPAPAPARRKSLFLLIVGIVLMALGGLYAITVLCMLVASKASVLHEVSGLLSLILVGVAGITMRLADSG